MSESAPERTGGGGNVFTRKIGPLPMWGWMAIALLFALFFYLWNKNKQSAGAASGSSPSTVNTPGGVDSSLVPQFVNQTYTYVQPPTAPNVTVNNPPITVNTPPDNDNPPPVQTGGGTSTSSPSSPLNEILKSGHTINPSPKNAEIGWTIA